MEADYELHKKFIDGLYSKYKMVPADLNGWWYIGGTDDEGISYHILCIKSNPEMFLHLELPPPISECVCEHWIKYNHWITDGEKVLVVGSCCRLQFFASGRNCGICHSPHLNRTVNRCNKCRMGICDKCNQECEPKHSKCSVCRRIPK
jgi:hypothetical protein